MLKLFEACLSFVILLVKETIFGMSGCFSMAQGQEIKE